MIGQARGRGRSSFGVSDTMSDLILASGLDSPLVKAFLIFYTLILLLVCVYGMHRYQLVHLFYKYRRNTPKVQACFRELPIVTIQLPMYNERAVARRIIDSTCHIDYPLDRLQIQVLDDSTDETVEIASRAVTDWQARGFDIELHPPYRQDRLQSGSPQPRPGNRQGRIRPDLRRRLSAPGPDSPRNDPLFHRSARRHGPGPVGAPESRPVPADQVAGHFARRPLRHRARRPESLRPIHEFQRDGRLVA